MNSSDDENLRNNDLEVHAIVEIIVANSDEAESIRKMINKFAQADEEIPSLDGLKSMPIQKPNILSEIQNKEANNKRLKTRTEMERKEIAEQFQSHRTKQNTISGMEIFQDQQQRVSPASVSSAPTLSAPTSSGTASSAAAGSVTNTQEQVDEFEGAGIVLHDNINDEDIDTQYNVQKEQEQSLCWSRDATLLLIDEYKDRQQRIENGKLRKNKAFLDIADIMKAHGYFFSADQCSSRIKTITRAYKQVKDHNAKSGNNKKTYEYEKQLDDLYKNRPNIQPDFVVGSGESSKEKEQKRSKRSSSEVTQSDSEPTEGNKSTPKSRKTQVSEVISYLETYTKTKEDQYKQEQSKKEERHKERMTVFREMISVLKKDSSNNE